MSDTCWLKIRFPRADLPKFNEVLTRYVREGRFWDEDTGEDTGDENVVDVCIYEANYGWCNEIEALAKAGLTFIVSHGAGGEYGPAVYACYKGDLVGCSSDWFGDPVVPVGKDGVDQKAVDDCIKYHRLVEKIEAEMQRAPTPATGTCFGCKYLTSTWHGDGSTSYGCALCPGLVTGESSALVGDDDPKRCDEYEPR